MLVTLSSWLLPWFYYRRNVRFARLRRIQSKFVGSPRCPRSSQRFFVKWRWLVLGFWLGNRAWWPSPNRASGCESKWRGHTQDSAYRDMLHRDLEV